MLTAEGFQTEIATLAATEPGQLIPHSIEAEQALLGALVIDPAQMLECGYLTRSDFYLTYNGHLYQAMAELFRRNQGYDIVTLTEYLDASNHLADIGGAGQLVDLINATPTSYGAPEYASIVYQHSISRQVIDRAMKATQEAYKPVAGRTGDMLINEVISSFGEIDATRNVSGGPQPMATGVSKFLDRIEKIEQTGQVSGLRTGIKTLDHILGGFNKKFYLLAGRPGMGKSALALQIAYNIARRGMPVLFFALEMSQEDIFDRLTSLISGIPYESFNRPVNDRDRAKIIKAADLVGRLPIIIDDTPALTAANIRSRSQKIMVSEPVGLIITDHGGIVKPERITGNKYVDQSQIADSLMALPKQLGCPVLSLLQLSRSLESRTDKRPMMHDLRDSGKWEENADGIMFLYRDEVYDKDTEFPHLGEISTAKNRGGKLGVATIYTDVATNRFVDLETRTVAI